MLLLGLSRRTRMRKRHVLKLLAEEREELEEVAKGRKGNRRVARWKTERARALLLCDQGDSGSRWTDRECAKAVGATENTVARWRRTAVDDGPLAVLRRKRPPAPPRAPALDGEGEAWLAKLACSEAPDGRSRWTLRLLAERLVELEVVGSISHETVRKTLKKTI